MKDTEDYSPIDNVGLCLMIVVAVFIMMIGFLIIMYR